MIPPHLLARINPITTVLWVAQEYTEVLSQFKSVSDKLTHRHQLQLRLIHSVLACQDHAERAFLAVMLSDWHDCETHSLRFEVE